MKPHVYISYKLPSAWLAKLAKHCALDMHPKQSPPSGKQFLAGVKKADGLLTVLNNDIDESILRTNPGLKIVANYAVGYDNIDLAAAKKYDVAVSNTPGDLSGAVAEHAMALILNVSKRIVEGDAFMRAKKYAFWDPLLLLGHDVRGKTLGIVGTGRIGSALCKIASHGFGMKILYHDVSRNKEIEKQYKAKKAPLNALLKQSDYVSLHVPLLPSTRHLIGATEIELMKKSAYLINTARGPVVNEKALVTALKNKTIAGAGLDVYEFEPKMAAGLSKLQNVVLTPHIASATYAARREMAEIAVQNLLDVLVRGRRPRNEVR